MPTTATANARTAAVERPNPFLMPIVYWRVSAFALTAVTLLGVVLALISGGDAAGAKEQFLSFGGHHGLGLTWTHTAVHAVLAGAAFLFGFANLAPGVTRVAAIVFGVVYAGLGVLGFLFTNPLGTDLALNLGVALNAVHLLLGGWALTAGIAGRY